MCSDPLDMLHAEKHHLGEWLNRVKEAQELVPQVQYALERIDWEIRALSELPIGADITSVTWSLTNDFERRHQYTTNALPLGPKYEANMVASLGAMSTAGTASTYQLVDTVGRLGTQETMAYAKKYISSYEQLQLRQDRTRVVRQLLEKLDNPGTLGRFDRATSAYSALKAGMGEGTAASMELRTLLDGVKGVLFERARKWKSENMTWDEMARRIGKGEEGGAEQQELVKRGELHSSLFSRLSDTGKDRKPGSLADFETLWPEALDHLSIVMGLVNL